MIIARYFIGMYEHQRKYRQSAHGRRKARERYPRVRAYHATDKGKACLRAGSLNTTAKNRGMAGSVTGDDVLALFANCVCAHPDCSVDVDLDMDHKVPAVLGGTNTLDNLCLLCKPHHKEKTKAEHGLRILGEGVPMWIQDLIGVRLSLPQLDLFSGSPQKESP